MKGPTITRHHAGATTALITLTLTLAACAGPPPSAGPAADPTTRTTTPTSAVAASDPGDVADAVARTLWATNATTDATPTGAAERSTKWFTPTYAAIAVQILPGSGGADWNELATHHGHTTVTIAPGDDAAGGRHPDTTTTATRVRILTLTPTGTDGWIGETRHLIATLTLVRAGNSSLWLVNAITADEALAGMPDGDVQDFR